YSRSPLTAREPRRDASSIAISLARPTAADGRKPPQTRRTLGAPNSNVAAIDGLSWDQPSSSVGYQHEEPVTTRCAEVLNDAAPALVAAPGANHDFPTSVPVARCRLDLHAMKPLSVVGDEVAVRTMSDR